MAQESYSCDEWCDLVRSIMDAAWREVPGSDSKRISVVKAAMRQLSEDYDCSLARGGPRFETPDRRMAYCALHLPSKARWMFDVLRSHDSRFRPLFSGDATTVWSIGGGPGSDLVGFLRRCSHWPWAKLLRCINFDREDGWGTCVAALQRRYQMGRKNATISLISPSRKPTKEHGDPKVVLLSYILSDVYYQRRKPGFRKTLESILRTPNPGSLLVSVDIATPDCRDWCDRHVVQCGYKKVDGFDWKEMKVKSYEWGRALGRYQHFLDLPAPIPAQVAFRLWERTG